MNSIFVTLMLFFLPLYSCVQLLLKFPNGTIDSHTTNYTFQSALTTIQNINSSNFIQGFVDIFVLLESDKDYEISSEITLNLKNSNIFIQTNSGICNILFRGNTSSLRVKGNFALTNARIIPEFKIQIFKKGCFYFFEGARIQLKVFIRNMLMNF